MGKKLGILIALLGCVALGVWLFLSSQIANYHHTGPAPKPMAESLPEAGWISLFDGQSLAGWTPKIAGYPVGENFADTYRVEQGAITVRYDQYNGWNGEFGNLFYKTPFSSYLLQLEYRFVGEQIADSLTMAWARRNSGVMFHAESPRSMQLDQSFPASVEAQLLGREDEEKRSTGNVCTPATHIELHGELHRVHCTNSLVQAGAGDAWVRFDLEVHPDGTIRHFIDGQFAIEYSNPVLDDGDADGQRVIGALGHAKLNSGYIALQSESHPVQFRHIRLLPLTEHTQSNDK